MELMKGEEILMTSDTKELTLTSDRIRFESKGYGSGNIISFFLTELDSCSITYKSSPILLILAALTFLGGIVYAGQNGSTRIALWVVTALFVLFYFLTRKSVLKISSKSSNIFINIKKMGLQKISELIDTIESAKKNIM